MSSHPSFRFRNPLLLMALAAAFPLASHAAGAASIDFAAGAVTAVNVSGVQRPLMRGAEIGNGDTIRTGEGGRAQVRFSDGGMVSLQPDTEFRIDNYQYSGKADGQEKGFFSLLKGGLRTITGLVGRVNRSNYQVTTNVATIGIRGTEYTAILGDGVLHVNTGEGLIEVCNAAGCMLLASGESGIVSGSRAPSRTDSKPQLPPTQPFGSTAPTYSKSEDRSSAGTILPVSSPLVSGSGYAVAYAVAYESGMGGASIGNVVPTSATFGATGELTSFDGGLGTWSAGSIAGSFSADGVVGWGRWSSGTSSSGSLVDLHYVTGIPTPAADINALTINATYNLLGYTLPTAENGTVGQAPSGTLTASFSGGYATLGLDLKVPIGGTTYNLNGTGSNAGPGSPAFSISSASGSASGAFFGGNASHAGLSYKLDSGTPMGYIVGAAAFKR